MKCFHFNAPDGEASSRIPWTRSLSLASRVARDTDFDGPHPPVRFDRLRAFRFAELKAATKGFSRALVIGEGGFGCVYHGVVRDADDEVLHVAVKKLDHNGLQGHQEWITEMSFLGVVNHPNLVKLIGFCVEEDERGIQRLLVYELMSNKSLEKNLLHCVRSPLSWDLRLRIARDAARGLAYLHEEMEFQLIFRDFKSANILLDENFNAKLSDFGLAIEGPHKGLGHILTSVVGTVGYAAPEYILSGQLTAKSDVWSYGVVLYEIITGRRSIDMNLPRREQKLLDWVKPYATDPKRIHFIVDRRLDGQYCCRSAQMLVALANKCLTRQPRNRPKMSEVVEMLDQIIKLSDHSRIDEGPQFVEEAISRKKIFDLKSWLA